MQFRVVLAVNRLGKPDGPRALLDVVVDQLLSLVCLLLGVVLNQSPPDPAQPVRCSIMSPTIEARRGDLVPERGTDLEVGANCIETQLTGSRAAVAVGVCLRLGSLKEPASSVDTETLTTYADTT
jgi:hypothetical protein